MESGSVKKKGGQKWEWKNLMASYFRPYWVIILFFFMCIMYMQVLKLIWSYYSKEKKYICRSNWVHFLLQFWHDKPKCENNYFDYRKSWPLNYVSDFVMRVLFISIITLPLFAMTNTSQSFWIYSIHWIISSNQDF